jgi:hypothetical protein
MAQLFSADAPWCEIRKTHASFPLVKTPWKARKLGKAGMVLAADEAVAGRAEPALMLQVSTHLQASYVY